MLISEIEQLGFRCLSPTVGHMDRFWLNRVSGQRELDLLNRTLGHPERLILISKLSSRERGCLNRTPGPMDRSLPKLSLRN